MLGKRISRSVSGERVRIDGMVYFANNLVKKMWAGQSRCACLIASSIGNSSCGHVRLLDRKRR